MTTPFQTLPSVLSMHFAIKQQFRHIISTNLCKVGGVWVAGCCWAMGPGSQSLLLPSGRLAPFAPRLPPLQRLSTQARPVVGYAVDSQNGATIDADNTVPTLPLAPPSPGA